MPDAKLTSRNATPPRLNVAFVKCTKCSSFLSIESTLDILLTSCPMCGYGTLTIHKGYVDFSARPITEGTCSDYDPDDW